MSEAAKQRGSEAGGREERTAMRVATFRDLIAWQRGMELAREVYVASIKIPDSERFGLISQMRRAAVSIPSNIAEGRGRQSRSDYIRHLRIARGSLAELGTQVELSVDLGLLPAAQQLVDLIAEEARILQALIKSLERLQSEAHA